MTFSRSILGVDSDDEVLRWLKSTGAGVTTGVIDESALTIGQKCVAADWRFMTTTKCAVWLVTSLLIAWLLVRSIIFFATN
jgi:hypothetical protein